MSDAHNANATSILFCITVAENKQAYSVGPSNGVHEMPALTWDAQVTINNLIFGSSNHLCSPLISMISLLQILQNEDLCT